MTQPSTSNRLRSHRIKLAAAGMGLTLVASAVVATPTETIAAFTDNVWAGSWFIGTSTFGIESSLKYGEDYTSHPDDSSALEFGPSISLLPGQTEYAGLFIKRAPNTNDHALVHVSGPTQGTGTSNLLWESPHLSFLAKYAPAATTGAENASDRCGPDIHTNPAFEDLYTSGTFPSPNPDTNASFTLGEPVGGLPNGEPYIVCFEFTLDDDVVTGPAAVNGQTIRPIWSFNAESVAQP